MYHVVVAWYLKALLTLWQFTTFPWLTTCIFNKLTYWQFDINFCFIFQALQQQFKLCREIIFLHVLASHPLKIQVSIYVIDKNINSLNSAPASREPTRRTQHPRLSWNSPCWLKQSCSDQLQELLYKLTTISVISYNSQCARTHRVDPSKPTAKFLMPNQVWTWQTQTQVWKLLKIFLHL